MKDSATIMVRGGVSPKDDGFAFVIEISGFDNRQDAVAFCRFSEVPLNHLILKLFQEISPGSHFVDLQ